MAATDNANLETAGAGQGSALNWIAASRFLARTTCGFRATEFDPIAGAGRPIAAPDRLDDASWTAVNMTVDSVWDTGPWDGSGGSTTDQVRVDAVNAAHYLELNTPRAFLDGRTYTFGFLHSQGGPEANFAAYVPFGADGPAWGLPATMGHAQIVAVMQSTACVATINAAEMLASDAGTEWGQVEVVFRMTKNGSVKPRIQALDLDAPDPEVFLGIDQGHYVFGVYLYEGDLGPETFESGWSLETYLTEIEIGVSGIRAAWDDDTMALKPAERFERAWGNDSYALTVLGAPATFHSSASEVEDFEREWGSNEVYETTISTGVVCAFLDDGPENFDAWTTADDTLPSSISATWDGAVAEDTAEDFEQVVFDTAFSVDFTTDVFTAPLHGLADGTAVYLRNLGGALPAPLTKTLRYFVRDSATNTFKVSLTSGGTAVNLTDNGTGDHSLRGDPVVYWVEPDLNHTI